jgi:cytidylate kinase
LNKDFGTRTVSRKGLVIAVDGPAASGKGTIARAVAKHFGLPHMDTGP